MNRRRAFGRPSPGSGRIQTVTVTSSSSTPTTPPETDLLETLEAGLDR